MRNLVHVLTTRTLRPFLVVYAVTGLLFFAVQVCVAHLCHAAIATHLNIFVGAKCVDYSSFVELPSPARATDHILSILTASSSILVLLIHSSALLSFGEMLIRMGTL
jgi:hypothetical protein